MLLVGVEYMSLALMYDNFDSQKKKITILSPRAV